MKKKKKTPEKSFNKSHANQKSVVVPVFLWLWEPRTCPGQHKPRYHHIECHLLIVISGGASMEGVSIISSNYQNHFLIIMVRIGWYGDAPVEDSTALKKNRLQ